MERSDPVTVILARIMKMMDRSSERLLKSIRPPEVPDATGEAISLPLAHGRRRDAQPNRDLSRRKRRDLEPDSFAPTQPGLAPRSSRHAGSPREATTDCANTSG
jgi:hypothetical protein